MGWASDMCQYSPGLSLEEGLVSLDAGAGALQNGFVSLDGGLVS